MSSELPKRAEINLALRLAPFFGFIAIVPCVFEPRPMTFTVCAATALCGLLISLVLFVRDDGDMRGLRALLIGALSGTGIAQSKEIASTISHYFWGANSAEPALRYRSELFFLALTGILLGLVTGYLTTRLDLEPMLKRRDRALKSLDDVPEPAALGVSVLSNDEMWPELTAKLPDEKDIASLASKNWQVERPEDALRAGAVFFAAKRWKDAENALEPALLYAEPPSASAFDFYIGAIVRDSGGSISGEVVHRVQRVASRLLTYFPNSFLVNVDLSYFFLYVNGRADLAIFYARRALEVRPDSAAANLNLACGLAAHLKNNEAATPEQIETVMDEIIAALERFFVVTKDPETRFNAEGDFDAPVIQNHPKFVTWKARRLKALS